MMNEPPHHTEQTPGERPEVLVAISSIFPFSLAPVSFNIDRQKITIVRKDFWGRATVLSVPLLDIHRVELSTGFWLGNVKIWTRFFEAEPLTVPFLKKNDAFLIKRLLDGIIIATEQNIDYASLPKDKLIPTLTSLGKGVPD